MSVPVSTGLSSVSQYGHFSPACIEALYAPLILRVIEFQVSSGVKLDTCIHLLIVWATVITHAIGAHHTNVPGGYHVVALWTFHDYTITSKFIAVIVIVSQDQTPPTQLLRPCQ